MGIFWQDAMANSAMFYFLNQGILMRFMAARSVEEGRRAALAVLAVLMPIAAVVVASGGWVGRALAHAGVLPDTLDGDEVFFVASELLARPGVFGLIMASLTAALMSTVDSLITAVAAIVVNDVVRPLRPDLGEEQLLRVARITSIAVALIGVGLVPVFSMFDSIYAAHGAFTAAVTPPMVVALLLGVFWRRYTPAAAMATMVGGSLAVGASLIWPELITPFAHGVPLVDVGDGFLVGAKQYKFMRAFYGLAVSLAIGVAVTAATRPRPLDEIRGWVWGSVQDAVVRYRGVPGAAPDATSAEASSAILSARPLLGDEARGALGRPVVRLSRALADALDARVGDVVYVCDSRIWLGGLNSGHAVVGAIVDGIAPEVSIPPDLHERVVGRRTDAPVRIQRLYSGAHSRA